MYFSSHMLSGLAACRMRAGAKWQAGGSAYERCWVAVVACRCRWEAGPHCQAASSHQEAAGWVVSWVRPGWVVSWGKSGRGDVWCKMSPGC